MFKGVYHLFVPMTPTQRAAADIAQLERDLYEARLTHKKSREDAEAKKLRIDQIKTHIDELKAEYPQGEQPKTTWLTVDAFDAQQETEAEKPADFMARLTRGRFARGGFVGKSE